MARMVKRGSKYLCWALLQAARTVSMRVLVFKEYLSLKKSHPLGDNFVRIRMIKKYGFEVLNKSIKELLIIKWMMFYDTIKLYIFYLNLYFQKLFN